jgi:ribonucleoside-triphosphate reductase
LRVIEEIKTNKTPYLYNSSLFQYNNSSEHNSSVRYLNHGILQKLSINLPRIAFLTKDETRFIQKLRHKLNFCATILNKKYDIIEKRLSTNHLPLCNSMIEGATLFQLNKQDLCIGFIGLNEAVKLLTNTTMTQSLDSYEFGLYVVNEMADVCTKLSKNHQKNFTLIEDTSERAIERFIKLDQRHFPQISMDCYNNSTKFGENIEIDLFKKLQLQGKFHTLITHGATEIVRIEEINKLFSNNQAILDFLSEIWDNTKIKCLRFKE